MLAFEIWIDGEKAMVAGVEDWSILAFHLDAIRDKTPSLTEEFEIKLAMGGLTMRDKDDLSYHFRWPGRSLPVGSVVTVRLVRTDSPDPPTKRFRSDREVQESPYTEDEIRQLRYADYLALKAEFESENSA